MRRQDQERALRDALQRLNHMTATQKDDIASRIARAVTDAFNRTGEVPTEQELKDAVLYVLDQQITP
jgi:hypothetical protein